MKSRSHALPGRTSWGKNAGRWTFHKVRATSPGLVLAYKLLYLVELGWMLLDTANGYLLNSGFDSVGGLSLGAGVRISVVLLLGYISFKTYRPWKNPLVYLAPLFLSGWMAKAALTEGFSLYKEIQIAMKICLPILFYLAIVQQIKTGRLGRARIRLIIVVNTLVLMGNLGAGLFGIGFARYGYNEGVMLGSKGFFFSGNELNAAYLLLYLLVIIVNIRSKVLVRSFWIFVFFLMAVLLFSKTSLGGYALFSTFLFFTGMRARQLLASVALLAAVTVVSTPLWQPHIEGAYGRWEYRANVRFEHPLQYYLGGFRTQRYPELLKLKRWEWALLLAAGLGWQSKRAASFENDFLDLLVGYGLASMCVFGMWIVVGVHYGVGYLRRRNPVYMVIAFGTATMIGIAVLAGHVMYSAMAALFGALVASAGLWAIPAIERSKMRTA